jgi:hypothetical protein
VQQAAPAREVKALVAERDRLASREYQLEQQLAQVGLAASCLFPPPTRFRIHVSWRWRGAVYSNIRSWSRSVTSKRIYGGAPSRRT